MQLPLLLPTSSWRPPAQLPELNGPIAIDVETYDPNLTTQGPGYKRNDGFIAGYALADATQALYLPIRHQGGDNLPETTINRYVQRQLDKAPEVIMANATYDLGWLCATGLTVKCPVSDIQVAEALLDEERFSYSLDNLAQDYLQSRKQEDLLRQAADAYEMANPKAFDPKADMWRLPARYVGSYAEADARLTWDIFQKQIVRLKEDALWQVWQLEQAITPILTAMSFKGVPVNLDAAERLAKKLHRREKQLQETFKNLDIWSPPQLAQYLLDLGLPVPRTDKGNYSVTKEYLATLNTPETNLILEAKGINRLRKVYIEDSILKGHYLAPDGVARIHCDFKQTASDEGGTRSGRLSSSNPNLQQVPKRSDYGKLIRELYIAEPGTLWCKADYSSQEPRLQVHYALIGDRGNPLPGAQEAADAFRRGVKLYTFFEEATGLPYDTCKMLCLGIGYGMGKEKMAASIGVSEMACSAILDKFNQKAPFLRMLFDRTMGVASERGYIRTIYGRKARFDFWSPGYDRGTPVKPLEAALKKYPNARLERAFTSKALNRLIQGSAADQTKLAMVQLWKDGFDLRLPVHDELNAMVETEDQAHALCRCMEEVLPLNLPSVADMDLGKTWK